MRVLFIQQHAFKAYGLMLLSASLKENSFETDILIPMLEKDYLGKLCEINPDIICISGTYGSKTWLFETLEIIKSRMNKHIIVGGPLATYSPDIIEHEKIDIICIGEGEIPIVEFTKKIARNEDITDIENIWVKVDGEIYRNPVRHLIDNLDTIPFADRNIYNRYPFFKLQNYEAIWAGRGCLGNCTFCYNAKYNEIYSGKGEIIRTRSVDNLIDEVRQIKKENKRLNHISFSDDNFFIFPEDWINEFAEKYKKSNINIPFSLLGRVDDVKEHLISKLKDAGCTAIRMGLESKNTFIREDVIKKGITDEQITNALQIIKKYKLKLRLLNIVGTPGDTLDKALETYEIAYKVHPQHAYCRFMCYYPGTEIFEIAKRQNLITENTIEFQNFYDTIPIDLKNKKEIVNLLKLFEFGNRLRIPTKLMKYLIRVPNNKVYDTIFKIFHSIACRKTFDMNWRFFLHLGKIQKYYFKAYRGDGHVLSSNG